MSRPRTDRLEIVEKVVAVLADEPALSANQITRRVRARRRDVLRAVRAVRRLAVVSNG